MGLRLDRFWSTGFASVPSTTTCPALYKNTEILTHSKALLSDGWLIKTSSICAGLRLGCVKAILKQDSLANLFTKLFLHRATVSSTSLTYKIN